jgi:HEAT repeat protein
MGFDFQNFGIGLLTGWATAYGVYRARHRIAAVAQSASAQAASTQNWATQTADRRYVNDLIELCETSHLAARFTKLSAILIEPRFLPAPNPVAPPDEEDEPNIFRIVPQVHDHPYLHAPYNVPTLSIEELGTGDRALALLGQPGSGRTTALLAIAMWGLGHVRFDKPIDRVQERLDAEEAKLSDKDRAVRVKERITIEQRAKERLAQEQGATFDAEADEATRAAIPLFNRLMPVYIHLADINIHDGESSQGVDPAEPLVRAVQREMGRVTASTIPRNLYKRLDRGQVLLLVDGYDELPLAEQQHKAAWLKAVMEQYPHNFLIVTGPACGYGTLLRLGLTPVFLRPWHDLDINYAAERWGEAWPRIGGSSRRPAPLPAPEIVQRAKMNSRALSPVDLTLKIWANYAEDTQVPGLDGWLRAYLARHLPGDQLLEVVLPQIAQIAARQLDEGFITLARLEGRESTGAKQPSAHEVEEALPDELSEPTESPTAGHAKDANGESESSTPQGKLLVMLRRSGLLIRRIHDRYRFCHPFIAAYLASFTVSAMTTEQLTEKALHPAWSQAIAYAAMHNNIEPAVRARLNAPADMLQSHVLEVARWLACAGPDAAWRGPLLKQLGNMLIAPSQYPALRERVAAALVSTRDKNTLFVFRQAVRKASPELRVLGALGIGALGQAEAANDLIPLLQDQSNDVQLAAGLALAAIGTDRALEAMIEAFTQGSEQLRQAIAETFAAIPDEGYPILYDAVRDEDMMLRRAAVFGLRRIKTTWSLIAIYRAFLEDDQWYVRFAAQQAFQELQYGRDNGPIGYPPAEGMPWLAHWAAKHGEKLPPGEGANHVLLKALQEGEPEIRALSATAMAQLGLVTTVRPLYGALRDRQAEVRSAAFRALAELQLQIGEPLPAPA